MSHHRIREVAVTIYILLQSCAHPSGPRIPYDASFEQHAQIELDKIEAKASIFAKNPTQVEYSDVKFCKNILKSLGKECGEDPGKIRAVSNVLGKLLARRQPNQFHEYYYLWLGNGFIRREPPESPELVHGLIHRIDAHEESEKASPSGVNQVQAEMAVICIELVEELLRPPVQVQTKQIAIDWHSWSEFKKWYTPLRSAFHYEPTLKRYVP